MLATDAFYIKQCLDGHPDDFRFLVQRYQGALMGHLTGKLGNRDRAEEAARESFVRAYFNVGKLKKPESFFAWLLGDLQSRGPGMPTKRTGPTAA